MNLILQFFSKEKNLNSRKEDLYQSAMPTVERYANNIGWDYCLETTKFFKDHSSVWEIFRILESSKYDNYKNIAFIDADVFAKNSNLDIFISYNSLAACMEVNDPHPKTRPEYQKWGNEYFNTGIVFFTREIIEQLRLQNPKKYRLKYKETVPGRDQYALNLMADQTLGSYVKIPRNDACFLRDNKYVNDATLVHVAGRCRQIYNQNISFYNSLFEVKENK